MKSIQRKQVKRNPLQIHSELSQRRNCSDLTSNQIVIAFTAGNWVDSIDCTLSSASSQYPLLKKYYNGLMYIISSNFIVNDEDVLFGLFSTSNTVNKEIESIIIVYKCKLQNNSPPVQIIDFNFINESTIQV